MGMETDEETTWSNINFAVYSLSLSLSAANYDYNCGQYMWSPTVIQPDTLLLTYGKESAVFVIAFLVMLKDQQRLASFPISLEDLSSDFRWMLVLWSRFPSCFHRFRCLRPQKQRRSALHPFHAPPSSFQHLPYPTFFYTCQEWTIVPRT